jgi:hypothetical protein
MTSYALTPPRIQLDMYNGDSVITIDRSITDAGNPVQRSSRYLRRIGSKLVTGNGAAYSVLDGGMTFEHEVDGRLYAGTDVRSNLFAIQWERAKIFNTTMAKVGKISRRLGTFRQASAGHYSIHRCDLPQYDAVCACVLVQWQNPCLQGEIYVTPHLQGGPSYVRNFRNADVAGTGNCVHRSTDNSNSRFRLLIV